MIETNKEKLEKIIEEAKDLKESDKIIIEAFSAGYKSGFLMKSIREEPEQAAG